MKNMKKIGLIFALFAGIVFWTHILVLESSAFADVVFITNNSVTYDSLTKAEIKGIFTGEIAAWHDGQDIKFITLKKGPTHHEFTRKYMRKSESQFLRYWRKQVFTGTGSMPKSFLSEKDLVDYVASTDGAIGYISATTSAEGVKNITISDM